MSTVQIPLKPGVPYYQQRTTLDGIPYLLTFRWSQRESAWYMDIASQAGTLLAGCIKLRPSLPLLAGVRAGRPEMPLGKLMLFDSRATPSGPSLNDLGDSVQLLYEEAS